MGRTLHYVYDPLCGWCYGAGGALAELIDSAHIEVRLWPSGLFSGEGARPMDDAFAAYAWANDQRIERLTGQHFSERYRSQVLTDTRQAFDSGPATVALTAVHLSAPNREMAVLTSIQRARYVDGKDVTRLETLIEVLSGLDLHDAAAMLRRPDDTLLDTNQARTTKARAMLREFGMRGVPAFILDDGGQWRRLDAHALHTHPQAFLGPYGSS